jgi:hypothetical protein
MMLYVDNMLRPARPTGYRGPGTPKWSHMVADTTAELLAAADRLGLRRAWLQHAGTPLEHFDVTNSVRERALHDIDAHPMVYGREGGLFTMWKRARLGPLGDDALATEVLRRARFDAEHAANCPKCGEVT